MRDYSMPLVSIPVIVTIKNNMPCIELRTSVTNVETIKQIISCSLHGRPIVLMPIFTNKLRSIASLIEKGIMYQERNEYYYLI